MKDNINIARLVSEIHERAADSRRLKTALRRTWTEPMGEVQGALLRCQRRTTRLCILRAWLRGRYHLQKPMRDGAFPGMEWNQERYHRLVAEKLAPEFQ